MGEVAASVGADMAEKYGPTLIMVAGGTIVIGGIAYFLYDEYINATAPQSNVWGDANNAIYVKDERLAKEAASGDCSTLINDKDITGLYDSDGALMRGGGGGALVGSYIEGPTPPLPASDEPPFRWQNWPPLWGIGLAGKWFGLGPFSDNRTATQKATAEKDQQAQKAMDDRKDQEDIDLQAITNALDNPACYLIYRDQVAKATTALQTLAQKNASSGKSPAISDQDVVTAMGNLPALYKPIFIKLQAYYNQHFNSLDFTDKLPSTDTPGNTQAFTNMKAAIDAEVARLIASPAAEGKGIAQAFGGNFMTDGQTEDILACDSILYRGHLAGCSEGDLDILLRYTYIKTLGYRGAPNLGAGYAAAPENLITHLGSDYAISVIMNALTSEAILGWCKHIGKIPIDSANLIIAQILVKASNWYSAHGLTFPNPIKVFHDYSSVN